jgi:hypothetical protein
VEKFEISGRRLGVELVPVVFEKDVEQDVVDNVVLAVEEEELEVKLELVEVVVLLDVDVVVLGVELVLEVVDDEDVDEVVGVVDEEVLLDDGIELDDVVEVELDVLTEAGFVSRKYAPTPAITTIMITIAAMTLDAIPRFTNIIIRPRPALFKSG